MKVLFVIVFIACSLSVTQGATINNILFVSDEDIIYSTDEGLVTPFSNYTLEVKTKFFVSASYDVAVRNGHLTISTPSMSRFSYCV